MGLFEKLSGIGAIQLAPKSALALAALTVIGADGFVEDEELEGLVRILKGDQNAFDRAFKVYKDKSITECVEIVSSLLDDKQKLAAIANLLDLAMADGRLAGTEKELLESYVRNFDLPANAVNEIVEVMAVKNDLSVFS